MLWVTDHPLGPLHAVCPVGDNNYADYAMADFALGLWELCFKFPSLFYSGFLSKFLHYAH